MNLPQALERSLRIVHVNTHDEEGGAAKVARQLCQLQNRAGHTAHLLVGRRKSRGGSVRVLDARPDQALELFCQEANLQYLHLQGTHDLDQHPLVAAADVVHLHNLHGDYASPLSLAALTRRKPTVWTLHDMHALTGFCNHSFDCDGWQAGCAGCGRQAIDRVRPSNAGTGKAALGAQGIETCFSVKKAVYAASVLEVACPSRWLAEKAVRSILGGQPVSVVPNAVNTRTFAPRDKQRARARLGLPQGAFIVGASAINGLFANPLKGGTLALAALERLRKRIPGALLLNIGTTAQSVHPGVVHVPFLRTESEMAWAYAALDALLHPAVAETFCLVAAEALACGRPVVAFNLGPLPEVVRHNQDGLLAPAGDAEALAENAARLAEDPALVRRMGEAARAGAVERFGLGGQVASYQQLYSRAISTHAGRLAAVPPLDLAEVPTFLHTPALLGALERAGTSASALANAQAHAHFDAHAGLQVDDARSGLWRQAQERARSYQHVFALRAEKRWAEALGVLESLLAAAPEEARLLRTYGVTLGLSGRPDLGLAAFARLAKADPMITDVGLSISDMYRLMGDADAAWAALEAMAEINPGVPGLFFRRGLVLQLRGDEAGAAAMYRQEHVLHGDVEAGCRAKALNRQRAINGTKKGAAQAVRRASPAGLARRSTRK